MITSALSSSGAPPRMTYARARLFLGISGVGTSVLIASALLFWHVPARTLSNSGAQSLPEAVASLLLILLIGVAGLFTYDLLGGAIVVRDRAPVSVFLARWLRGVTVQLFVWTVSATALTLAARVGGTIAIVLVFVALQFALAALRAPLMRAIATFRSVPVTDRLRRIAERAGIAAERIDVLASTDEGFVGGWSGIAPRRLVLPARWLELPDDALVAALQRRRIIAESGAHLRGVLGAITWNTVGLVFVLAFTGAVIGTAAGMLTLAAGMTLWAFLGVLLLPTPSRAAVLAVDAAAAREVGATVVQDAIEQLDRWQDDEPKRSVRVETIFHPVPSRFAREANLAAAPQQGVVTGDHAHHVARHALWLGWATLSPISRAVHCNVGRPALWAMLPGD